MAGDAKFTKGPWRDEPDSPVTGYADIDNLIVGADGCSVATICGIRDLQPRRAYLPLKEQALANARLIAAAPDLYEAAEFAEATLAALVEVKGVVAHPAIVKIRAAIAKAEGR